MSFSYGLDNSDLDIVRMMVSDTMRSIPQSGTCNVSGTAVSGLTGDPFSTTMNRITINATQYAIAQIVDEGNLVLSTSAGTLSNVAWTGYRAIWDDQEINRAIYLTSSQGIYTSGQAVVNGNKGVMPVNITSPYMAAAILYDSLAGSGALLAGVLKVLDVELNSKEFANQLRETAKEWRTVAQNDGSFAIAEQVQDAFSARRRAWNQILRIEGGG